MVSLSSSGSLLFPLATKSVSSRLSRLANSDKKPVNSFCYKVKEEQRKVVCACVAPPRDLGTDGFPATKFNVTILLFGIISSMDINMFDRQLVFLFVSLYVWNILFGDVYNCGYMDDVLKDSSKSENVNTLFEAEDDGDVLIECRNVYKSFGEKHILRGVSFKVNFIWMW